MNYSKSKNLIIGSKKFRQKTVQELQSDPILMGGKVLEHESQEKYLGDIIDEDARRASPRPLRGESTNSTASVRTL